MVDVKLIIVGVLALLVLWQYNNPTKSHDFLEPYLDGIADFVDFKNPFKEDNGSTKDICANQDINKVCGFDGVTYDNLCYATQANVTDVTIGEC